MVTGRPATIEAVDTGGAFRNEPDWVNHRPGSTAIWRRRLNDPHVSIAPNVSVGADERAAVRESHRLRCAHRRDRKTRTREAARRVANGPRDDSKMTDDVKT